MTWVVLLIIALVAYFLFQGLHARHISRCQSDIRTAEYMPDNIIGTKEQADFHERTAASMARNQQQRGPAPHQAPSLLYADRPSSLREQVRNGIQHAEHNQQTNSTTATRQTTTVSGGTQCTTEDNIDMNLVGNATADNTVDTMEFTAENAPIRNSEVGTPDSRAEHATANSSRNDSNTGIAAAGAAVATAAGITAAASAHGGVNDANFESSTSSSQGASEHQTTYGAGTTENIDLELGESDNTYNDAEDIEGHNHDELLDFGDLTSDISDMLKELNLRESDSPRLEINEAEFEQLKTGEPGEVKPAKIENVADKLRNMLQ